ncbi:MAG TPA: helix-turn-helix transcriptional regulator [Candidatus Parabacteroides intestinigallinarum]|uniref:Helix-turn-helix transcriptional regulator n=1 Tax=Candidatus Parabacteroides intestinigallinarum TaxID=2838722 RepID=A0A9D2BN99_9BACT|nr:helix-turn-helix transcriptional regulator [Candidatus Parabacteroides intestinigallinarum]
MEKEQGMLNRSNYRNDQRASGNTLPGEVPILGLTHVKADQSIAQEKVERLTLLFVLSGNLYFSTAGIENQPVDEGHMFLVLAGDNFYMRAITEVTLLRCAPPLETLYKRMADIVSDSPSRERKRIPVLPLQALLLRELHTIQEMMRAGILSPYVQRLKTELVLSVLRELYAKGELAAFFTQAFTGDHEFKAQVLKVYSNADSVKELAYKMNISISTLKRKFQSAFGMSVKQWLIQKRKERLLHDITQTKMSIAELAEKYKLTGNYLSTFCREHFGKSPTELRS